ncbi:MAG: acyl--CoA ligase [Candidatus Poribacteria bacterium]|nr:acyl--CoA ligase [Candidatus Poribacteria bacterium]
MSTLTELLSPDYANQTAIVIPDGGPTLTYAESRTQVAALAEMLKRGGIRAGDPVSIVLPNGLEFLTTFLAVTWARGIAAPLNPAYTAEEFQFYMEDAEARAVIVPPGAHPAREAAATLNVPVWEAHLDAKGLVGLEPPSGTSASVSDDAPQADDVALFLHTSGTTSRPKGVPLTHGNLTTSLGNIVNTYELTPEHVSLIVMPLFHVHGLLGATLSTLSSGGTVVIPPRFSASSFWQQVTEHRVNWYSAVPTIHQILLARDDDDGAPNGALRFIRSCSAALAPAVLSQLEDRFGAPVLEAYGMTEASHQMSSNPLPPGVRKPGAVGMGTGVDITILDEEGAELPEGMRGEVSIRGRNVTKGYHNNPEANAAAFTKGWFRTGDQGFIDSDNYLTLTGRLKELINRGGEKISPLEVDAVMLEHPDVAEAVCFGVPDEKYGEEVHAAVVLKGEVSEEALIAFCHDHLADFKTPKKLYIADTLPRTATGKIQRRHVAAHFRE